MEIINITEVNLIKKANRIFHEDKNKEKLFDNYDKVIDYSRKDYIKKPLLNQEKLILLTAKMPKEMIALIETFDLELENNIEKN